MPKQLFPKVKSAEMAHCCQKGSSSSELRCSDRKAWVLMESKGAPRECGLCKNGLKQLKLVFQSCNAKDFDPLHQPNPAFIASSPQLHKALPLLLCNSPSFFPLFSTPFQLLSARAFAHFSAPCTSFCLQLGRQKTRGGKGELVEQCWKTAKEPTAS